MPTRVLTQANVRSILTMELALSAVEDAFRAHGRGESIMPPKVYLSLPHHSGDLRAMPAYMAGTAGVKWVCSYPENPQTHGLPSVMAVYILNDPATGAVLSVMDATAITAYRTGAAAAIATKHLFHGEPKTLGIVGCGAQSRHLVAAHRLLWPQIDVRCADVARRAAERIAAEIDGSAVDIEEAAHTEVLCTATPSRHPLIKREWVRDGSHINAMGADAPGKQELDPQILLDARVVLDDVHQATESGEVNVPIEKGLYTANRVHGTLGEIVANRLEGRGAARITVFDSTGLAIQDTALARAVYEAAREQNLGQEIDLI